MKILKQLAIIMVFGFAGELIYQITPFNFPGTVSGMLLMLLFLGIKVLRPEHIEQTADFLSANMAFFLIPAAVRILDSYDAIRPILFKLFLICFISTITTFMAAYIAVRITQILLKKRRPA